MHMCHHTLLHLDLHVMGMATWKVQAQISSLHARVRALLGDESIRLGSVTQGEGHKGAMRAGQRGVGRPNTLLPGLMLVHVTQTCHDTLLHLDLHVVSQIAPRGHLLGHDH